MYFVIFLAVFIYSYILYIAVNFCTILSFLSVEDLEKLTEIKHKMEKTIKSTNQNSNNSPPTKQQDASPASANQSRVSAPEPTPQDEDILKKFGVTFSYGEEEPALTSGSEVMAAAAASSQKRQEREENGGYKSAEVRRGLRSNHIINVARLAWSSFHFV